MAEFYPDDFSEAQFMLEGEAPEEEYNDDSCFVIKYDSAASKFRGRYVGCEEEYGVVCFQYFPEDPCQAEEKANSDAPLVDKLINTNKTSIQKREQYIRTHQKDYKNLYKQLNLTAAYDNLFDLLWYSTLPCFSIKGDPEDIDISMLKLCKWKGERVPCASIFDMFPTDRGMCCTFNMEKADTIFRESQFQKSIIKLQEYDRLDGKESTQLKLPNWYKEQGEPKPQAGVSKGLSLVLDAHTDILAAGSVGEDFQGFFAVVDARDAYPQTDQKNVRIRPGYDNLVALNAIDVKAVQRIDKVDAVEHRKCYFRDEYKLELHAYYTQASCMLECRIHYVQNNVSCVPW